jgi:hypothetical protein
MRLIFFLTDPKQLEALASREGQSLTSDLGIQSFTLASDCANLVRYTSSWDGALWIGDHRHQDDFGEFYLDRDCSQGAQFQW